MKKQKRKAREREHTEKDEPFTDFTPEPIIGFTDPKIGDIPLKELCEKFRMSRFKNDEGLRILVRRYWEVLGKENQERAITAFWKAVSDLMQGNDSYFSDKHFEILQSAFLCNISAIQRLVRANPDVVYLPFVQEAMVKMLNDYKHKTNLKETGIKKEWLAFLTSRDKNIIPYSDDDIQFLFKLAMKEFGSAKRAREKLSKYLGISERKLLDMTKIKKTRGRPTQK